MEGFWGDSINKRVLESALSSNKGLDHVTRTVTTNVTTLVEEDPVNNSSAIATCGSRLLDQFIRFNWVGPNQADLACPYRNSGTKVLDELNAESLEALSSDGEPVYSLCRHPLLLWLAHTVLVDNSPLLGPSAVVWTLRCLFVRQRMLTQRSASLWSQISHLIEGDIQRLLEADKLSGEKKSELYLELAHILLYYSQYQETKRYVSEAGRCLGLKMELRGAMGKRTKFQEKDLAQLLLSVTSTRRRGEEEEGEERSAGQEVGERMVPKNVQLQDETVLDGVVYSDPETTPTPRLTSLEQAVVLGQCVYRLRSLPIDRLGYEEAEAFIQCVLCQPLCWCVQSVALFLRCQSERRRSRKAERAMLQLEELTQSYSASKDDHTLDLFYCLPVPTIWAIEKEYADVLLSVGATKSALEVYERLEMWEEVAECSSAVGRTGKVREVVTERLERGAATPTLLCVLGDVTRDPEDYRRAWHMSEGRCGRAQRSLGYYHLRRKEYKECIPAFQLSLKINSLQEKVWFSLGCAAQQVGDQELAVQAFQRCVSLEADFAEAWNNLATIYLTRKEKVKAFRAFQEAVKCNYDSWKIWENLLVVSVEIGELRQSLQAYHRILDLQNKFLDVEILRCVVRAVLDGQEDRSGQSAGRLRESVGQLLGRVTSQVTGNSDVWELYGDYHCSSSDTLDQEKVAVLKKQGLALFFQEIIPAITLFEDFNFPFSKVYFCDSLSIHKRVPAAASL
jgi:tetratricopeptide (TPR) repeat protein